MTFGIPIAFYLLMVRSFVLFVFLSPMISLADPLCVDIVGDSVNISKNINLDVPPASSDDFLKHYLALNMTFPQYRETINLGITAFYFARDIDYHQMTAELSEEQWQSVYSAMMKAHAAYGVSPNVTLGDVKGVLYFFVSGTLAYRIQRVFDLMVFPETFAAEEKNLEKKIDLFMSDQQYALLLIRLRRYSQTILEVLRSPEVREMARRFREGLRPENLLSPQKGPSREDTAHQIHQLVVKKLMKQYSELRKPGVYRTSDGPSRTLAEALYSAMAGGS